ncbi:hypothetical protein AAHS21_31585 [Mycobacterium sp. 050272]|uniref:hypothetical protein n=1 Tax=Mycobacterium sp. 050272 TaxID=3142488 RepID=UPI0031853BD9
MTVDPALAIDTSTEDRNVVFIAPRADDHLLLDGLVEPGECETDLTLNNYPPTREILKRCIDFTPILQKARLETVDPIRLELRPFRSTGVREPGAPIAHDYSHGGVGVTLSRGCSYRSVSSACGLLRGTRGLNPLRATINNYPSKEDKENAAQCELALGRSYSPPAHNDRRDAAQISDRRQHRW